MSVQRGFGLNGAKYFTNITVPQDVKLTFTVDSTNTNQLGQSSLKSNGYVQSVYMNTSAGAPTGTLAMGTSRTYGVLASTTTTAAGTSVVTGNLGLYPGTAVTGYPPSTVSGVTNVANVAAQQAKAQAQAAYTAGQALPAGTAESALDGLTLTPGTYTSATSMSLAASGAGTLTLNGLGVYIFQMGTTLTTGAGGVPTITLSGGARAQDIYWLVGSSATINSGNGGTFKGNVLANTSITVTTAGTVNGSLIALNGAVTLTGNIAVNAQALSPTITAGHANPLPGYCWIQFKNAFNVAVGNDLSIQSPNSSSEVSINSTSLTIGQAYTISTLGTSTAADWTAIGLPGGLTATVGQSFICIKTGNGSGTGKVKAPSVSGVNSMEVVGDPNQEISPANRETNAGAWVLVQFLSNGTLNQPTDGTVVSMSFHFDRSSVTVDGL